LSCPISLERLVLYWIGDLEARESDEIEEHLFTCPVCFEAAGHVAALATGVRKTVLPVVLDRDLEQARARGARVVINDFLPGVAKEALFARDVDLLVHRLRVPDLSGIDTVAVTFTLLDGTPLLSFDDAPFDRASSTVQITCHRHFEGMFPSPDLNIVVRGTDAAGRDTTETFTVLHRFV
jgi:hypothetical protein